MEYHERTQQQDMAEPLIQQDEKGNISSEEDDDFKQKNTSQNGSLGVVWLSTAVALWGSFQLGCCGHYTSSTQTAIRRDLNLSLAEAVGLQRDYHKEAKTVAVGQLNNLPKTPSRNPISIANLMSSVSVQYSVFASILSIGAMIGGLTSGHISDFIGRKGAIRVAAVFCLVGWLAIFFTEGVLLLDIGRMCTGYGVGIFSYVVHVFIAEIAPKDLRGGFTSLSALMSHVRGSITYLLGTVLTWRMLTLVGLIPSIMLLLGMFFVPESPRWLMMVGQQREFEATLQRLRGKDADISFEASEIQEYTEKLQRMPKIRILDLFQKRYLHSIIIGVGLMLFKQLGGISAINSYVNEILELAGFSSGKFGTIVIGLCQIPVTAVSVALMDRCGRRPLLLISSVGTFLGTFLIGVAFCLKDHELLLKLIPMMVLAGVLIELWSFASGIGAGSWVIMSEIFPLNIKGAAGSLAVWANWFGSWAVTFTFNYLISWSSSGTFFLYSAVSAAAILFVAKLVPETGRRTLEEIQAHMLFSSSHS